MRCTQVEKLLPLHVGADLPTARAAGKVAAHLAECEACRLKAEEFEASRSLLALHAPPAFDDAFFASVRRNVMREIEDERARPAPFASLRSLFAPRTLAVAASLALLVVCALVGFRIYRRALPQHQPAQESADMRPRGDERTVDSTGGTAAHDPQREERRQKTASVPSHSSRTTRRLAPLQTQTTSRRSSAPTGEPSPAHKLRRPTQLEALAVNMTAALPEVAERKVTRIELQTGDPNVRIIWLSPRVDDKPTIKRETKR